MGDLRDRGVLRWAGECICIWSTAACFHRLWLLSLLVYLRAVSFTQKAVTPFHRPSQPFRCALWSIHNRMKTHFILHTQEAHTYMNARMHSPVLSHSLMYRHTIEMRYTLLSKIHIHTNTHVSMVIDTGNCRGFYIKQIIVITFSLKTEQCDRIIVLSIMLIQKELYSGDFKISHPLDDILTMF